MSYFVKRPGPRAIFQKRPAMIIAHGHSAIAQCDSCGDRAEAHEERNRKTGALTAAFLPAGWQLEKVEGEPVHRCAECVAASEQPFADRREAFEARLEQLGAGLTVDIAKSLGVPIALGRRWADEWRSGQFQVRTGQHQVGDADADDAADAGPLMHVLHAGRPLDDRAVPVERLALRHAGDARQGGQRGRLHLDIGDQGDAKRNRGRWHAASMRDQRASSNRGKK